MAPMLGVVDLLRAVRGTVSLRFRRWRTPGGLAALVVVGGVLALWVVIWIPGDADVDPPAGAAPRESSGEEEREADESTGPGDDAPTSSTAGEAAPGTTSTGPVDPGGTSTTGNSPEPGAGSDTANAPTRVEPGPAGNTPTPTSPPSSSPTTTTPGTTTTTAPPSGTDGGWLDDLLDVLDLG
jgi:hypothetical protein